MNKPDDVTPHRRNDPARQVFCPICHVPKGQYCWDDYEGSLRGVHVARRQASDAASERSE